MNDSGTVDSRKVLEYIRTIVEDSIIRDSELEVCNRAIDLALKSIDDCGLLRTKLEIAEQTIKQNEWVSVNDRLPSDEEIAKDTEFLVKAENSKGNLINTVITCTKEDKENREWTFGRYDRENNKPTFRVYEVVAWKKVGNYE